MTWGFAFEITDAGWRAAQPGPHDSSTPDLVDAAASGRFTAGVHTADDVNEVWRGLPTEEDIAFYETHGWWVSPRLFSEDQIDRALDAANHFYQAPDHDLPAQAVFSNWKPADGLDVTRNNEFVSLQSNGLREFACSARIGAIAARLARVDEIRLLDDQLVYKPPGVGAATTVGWHADHAYWGTCSSDRLLTAWIPFHDIDENRGTLCLLDGSHRWPDIDHARFFNDTDLVVRRADLAPGREVVEVPVQLRKGQASFHHGWTLHASYPNRSTQFRLALAVHLQDGANHYRAFHRPDGQAVHIADELLCRTLPNGDPDFADPAVFPMLWPAGQPAR